MKKRGKDYNYSKDTGIHVREEIVKIGQKFSIVKTFATKSGEIVERTVSPLMFKFERKDIAQVFIGSLLLASPFAVTEEVWNLGQELSLINTMAITLLSLLSLIVLIYYTRYQNVRTPEGRIPRLEFFKRIFGTYMITLLIVGILLTVLDKAPWQTDYFVAVKRTVLVSLPASLGGAAADLVK
jgi:uncharacterized membrane protein